MPADHPLFGSLLVYDTCFGVIAFELLSFFSSESYAQIGSIHPVVLTYSLQQLQSTVLWFLLTAYLLHRLTALFRHWPSTVVDLYQEVDTSQLPC